MKTILILLGLLFCSCDNNKLPEDYSLTYNTIRLLELQINIDCNNGTITNNSNEDFIVREIIYTIHSEITLSVFTLDSKETKKYDNNRHKKSFYIYNKDDGLKGFFSCRSYFDC
jgi:hypothetical protein